MTLQHNILPQRHYSNQAHQKQKDRRRYPNRTHGGEVADLAHNGGLSLQSEQAGLKETRHTRRNNEEEKGESRENGKVVGERGRERERERIRWQWAAFLRRNSRPKRTLGGSYVWLRLVNCPVGWYFWFAASLLSSFTDTPADHDLAERSAKQHQDNSLPPALSTSLSLLPPSYTVTLACIQPANEAADAHLPKKEGHAVPVLSPIHLTSLGARAAAVSEFRRKRTTYRGGIAVIAIRSLASVLASKMEVASSRGWRSNACVSISLDSTRCIVLILRRNIC
ncbi:unnamed protein product, partial [Heterotrigona itama]